MSDILDSSLLDAAAAIRARKISSVELTSVALARIAQQQPRLNCFISLDADEALAVARRLDEALAADAIMGPLHGVPLAHKDMYYRRGKVTTCGSKIRRDFVPDHTATALDRLAAAGAVNLGGLNMSEFAVSPTGHNFHYGPARNPVNPEYITGGSSSGSAAAVAGGLVFGALGSDTGGSIRLPAACCGVVGLKPTHTRVSRFGAMGLSFSLDTVGPLARTVADAAVLLRLVAGHDPNDATSSRVPVPDYTTVLGNGVAGLKIGVPAGWYYDRIDPEVERLIQASLRVFETLGARLVEVAIPHHDVISDLQSIVMTSEAATLHKKWLRERPQDYGPQVRARILPGLSWTATQYLEASQLREKIVRDFVGAVYSCCDVLHLPVLQRQVPTIAETDVGAGPEMAVMINDMTRCTRPINYLGLPSLAVPCGATGNGLPNAFQLVGRPFAEALLFQAGTAYERAAGGRPGVG
jgi:aspartyl-tRNA(Asn)/glutamyl-tRNA(Gln) amidotransferase subunit A